MPIIFKKHVFEQVPHRALQARDRATYRCSVCGKRVQIGTRLKAPLAEKIAGMLKSDPSECPGPTVTV